MIEEWRLLDTGLNNAFYNMALDEAIVTARSNNLVPNTLRFFRWEPAAVSIGYFQGIKEEVDLEVCSRKGIDTVRRRTGGGAVYHDTHGELTYSLMVNIDHRLVSTNYQEAYRFLCSGLVRGLQRLGIPAEFKPINDIIVDNKKISGNAQTRSMNVVHQHGTILRKVDPSLMFTVLKVPNEKVRDKLIMTIEERVTSIDNLMKTHICLNDLKNELTKGFEEVFEIRLVPGEIIEFEKKLTSNLATKKYGTREWNFMR